MRTARHADGSFDPDFEAETELLRKGRMMLFSKKLRIGLDPLTAEKGDFICVVMGGEVPLVLRPDGNEFLYGKLSSLPSFQLPLVQIPQELDDKISLSHSL
jgi:hypothetical protein